MNVPKADEGLWIRLAKASLIRVRRRGLFRKRRGERHESRALERDEPPAVANCPHGKVPLPPIASAWHTNFPHEVTVT
jgi:hypothetical protein